MIILQKKIYQLLTLLTLLGSFLHFFNLNWGAPYYFHPDERNIAIAVSQLQFSSQMNPHFFAYGSFPIYVIYFVGVINNFIMQSLPVTTVPFEKALIISRIFSALFATALIPLLFVIARNFSLKSHPEKANMIGLLAAFFAATSVGFIQFAHFGTFEMWLTFLGTLLFWLCLQPTHNKTILLLGVVSGMLIATKVSSLVLLPIPLVIIISKIFQTSFWEQKKKLLRNLLMMSTKVIIFLISTFLVYFLTNPFVFLDFPSFHNSMNYESSLVLGSLPVFYTGEFFNTIPIIFQFTQSYPFLLNPLITLIFIPSFFYLIVTITKTKQSSYILLVTFFLLLFLSQAFFFAKWTRYLIPTIPFIYVITAIGILSVRMKVSKMKLFIVFIAINFLFAFSYFMTGFIQPDTRVAAANFAQENIPQAAPILSEVYDLGIVPFNDSLHHISLFHFYDLDNNSPEATIDALNRHLSQVDYIILPSQRILKTRLMKKDIFPKAHAFYEALLSGRLGFEKIYETPCDIWCKITYLGDPMFRFEQTVNVFDRPTVMIFKKI